MSVETEKTKQITKQNKTEQTNKHTPSPTLHWIKNVIKLSTGKYLYYISTQPLPQHINTFRGKWKTCGIYTIFEMP